MRRRALASRQREQGTIMVLVMTILAALLAGGAVALYLQVSSTRATSAAVSERRALYCAEAGLEAARNIIGQNQADWAGILSGDSYPTWYPTGGSISGPGIEGDIDGDGVPDYQVTIEDNDDEFPPLSNDLTQDNDLRIFSVSECVKYEPNQPREVRELIEYKSNVGCGYRNQGGQGCGNTGNVN